MKRFTAKIYKLGSNPVVDPPDNVLEAIFVQAAKSKGPIPVRGKLNGADFVQTLVKYQGAWRLYINGPMLASSGLNVGDIAKVQIEFDPDPRDVPMSPELKKALINDKEARKNFDQLSPSRRKEILRYLASLKSRESIQKNVDRIIRHLKGLDADAQHGLMRRPKIKK